MRVQSTEITPFEMPRALLVTGTAPGEPSVGGVILRDLIQHAGLFNWHCCWLASRHGQQRPYWNELPTTVLSRKYETSYRPVRGMVGEAASTLIWRLARRNMISTMRQRIIEQCDQWQPEYVVAVLESPAAIETVYQFQQRSSIPVRSIVWDDVHHFSQQAQLDRWTHKRLTRTFGQVLQASERVAVICENMQAEYHRRYGIDSLIVRHGVAPTTDEVPVDAVQHDEYRIGFAGSNTAPDSLRALIDSLDALGWRIQGRDVVLRMLGARYLLDSRLPQRIEYFGWRSVEETRARLSECDLLYLPQSFTAENRTLSELSFPTKLSTYLAARRPILLHAPDYGSLTGFWRRHGVGPEIHSLDKDEIQAEVKHALLADAVTKARWTDAGVEAIETTLGPKQFTAAVEAFLS